MFLLVTNLIIYNASSGNIQFKIHITVVVESEIVYWFLITDGPNGRTLLGSVDYSLLFAYAVGNFIRCVHVNVNSVLGVN